MARNEEHEVKKNQINKDLTPQGQQVTQLTPKVTQISKSGAKLTEGTMTTSKVIKVRPGDYKACMKAYKSDYLSKGKPNVLKGFEKPVEPKLYETDDIFEILKKMFPYEQLSYAFNTQEGKIEFLNDMKKCHDEQELGIDGGPNSIEVYTRKYFKCEGSTSKIATFRYILNQIRQAINLLSGDRIDFTSPKMRAEGYLDMTKARTRPFYSAIMEQMEIMKDIAPNDNRRKLDYTTGKFKTI